jgi:hypothetical protein
MPPFWNVARIPDAAPRARAGAAFMTPVVLGAVKSPKPIPFGQQECTERGVGEVDGQGHEQAEARRRQHHPAGGEGPDAVTVGEPPGHRPGHQKAGREREHVDAGPQRCPVEAVAVQGQPDALEPDDEHELEAAASDRGQQCGHAPGGEGPQAEQRHVERGIGHPALDPDEQNQQGHPAPDGADHRRIGPTHGVATVRLDPVGDPGQDGDEPGGEGDVPHQSMRAAVRWPTSRSLA